MEQITVNGKPYRVQKLLGHGKHDASDRDFYISSFSIRPIIMPVFSRKALMG